MSEWQPIETAPKDDTIVDLWVQFEDSPNQPQRAANCYWREDCIDPLDSGWECIYAEMYSRDAGIHCPSFPVIGKPTHWMPLPAPPKEAKP